MEEIDVVRQVRTFLLHSGLADHRIVDLYTDAHATLTRDPTLRPFQRFTLALDGFSVHPDLVGRLDDGETTFAIEAKGQEDHLRGLAQAACYRFGFHLVFLATADHPAADLVALARQQHVGILAVHAHQVHLIEMPVSLQPLRRHARAIQQQFRTMEALQTTFAFNIPTHYLSIAAALRDAQQLPVAELEAHVRLHYPELPSGVQSFRSAVRGARKLGLCRLRGDQVELTVAGDAAASLLPDLAELGSILRVLTARGGNMTLDSVSPQAGAVLRWLMAADPIADVIIATLSDLGGGPVSMKVLATHSLERDRVRGLTAFFNPDTVDQMTNTRGDVLWNRVEPGHFRSTTFYQYKSMLKHAGVIAPHPLGGASVRGYNPDADMWELQKRRTPYAAGTRT